MQYGDAHYLGPPAPSMYDYSGAVVVHSSVAPTAQMQQSMHMPQPHATWGYDTHATRGSYGPTHMHAAMYDHQSPFQHRYVTHHQYQQAPSRVVWFQVVQQNGTPATEETKIELSSLTETLDDFKVVIARKLSQVISCPASALRLYQNGQALSPRTYVVEVAQRSFQNPILVTLPTGCKPFDVNFICFSKTKSGYTVSNLLPDGYMLQALFLTLAENFIYLGLAYNPALKGFIFVQNLPFQGIESMDVL